MTAINFNSGINSLGYGIVGFNLYKELSAICDVTLWPMQDRVDWPVTPTQEIADLISRDIAKQDSFNHRFPCLKVWHENQLAQRIGEGKYFVLPFFEVNKFNVRRQMHMLSADEIIVTSKWAKDIVEKEIGCDSYVVPCGVDREIFNVDNNQVNDRRCIFFNCGKWEVRKGHDILRKAFDTAFPSSEPVELWMMTQNPFLTEDETREWEWLYQSDTIKLIPRVQYQEQLAEIMSQVYCGVFPARAEGWNLELLELMSMGKQVITTSYSAHTEFCTPDNSLLIDITEEEPMYDGKWFVGEENGTWASLEGKPFNQLVDHLRSVYEVWKTQPHKENDVGILTAERLTWEKMARSIHDIILDTI